MYLAATRGAPVLFGQIRHNETPEIQVPIRRRPEAVSYTHLDVYKRQDPKNAFDMEKHLKRRPAIVKPDEVFDYYEIDAADLQEDADHEETSVSYTHLITPVHVFSLQLSVQVAVPLYSAAPSPALSVPE